MHDDGLDYSGLLDKGMTGIVFFILTEWESMHLVEERAYCVFLADLTRLVE